jgi:hypothetical protein
VEVTFTRTAERRYSATITRERWGTVSMMCPGYDTWLPHDLVHFVAEAECRIEYGLFGRYAAGFDPSGNTNRFSELVKGQGQLSERIVTEATRAWKAAAAGHRATTVSPEIARVVARLEELAPRWHALRIGESLTLPWPWPERLPTLRSGATRKAHARGSTSRGRSRR